MARRGYSQAQNLFRIPVHDQLHNNQRPLSPQLSLIERILRATHSVKRFFSTSNPKEPDIVKKATVQATLHKRIFDYHGADASNIVHQALPKHLCERDFFVPSERSRRNGIIFEDITVWTEEPMCNSNMISTRKRNTITLADIDFTQPQPEWLAQAFVQTAYDSRLSPIDLQRNALPASALPTASKNIDLNSFHAGNDLSFVPLQELRAIKDACASSISALPPNPGHLQQILFAHAVNSLYIIVSHAEESVQQGRGLKQVSAPSHFVEAMLFLTSSCKEITNALTADSPIASHVPSISSLFLQAVALVVRIAKVIDGADGLDWIKDSMRDKCVGELTSAVDILVAASSQFVIDAEATLKMIGEVLNGSVPVILLSARFQVCKSYVDIVVQKAIERILTESTLSQSVLDKLAGLIHVLKRIRRQLERIAIKEHLHKNAYRLMVEIIDLKYEMLKAFVDATTTMKTKDSFNSFKSASELAQRAAEPLVQAECLYQMASIIIKSGKVSYKVDPKVLISSARSLNSSEDFQIKVSSLVTILGNRTISSTMQIVATLNGECSPVRFIEGLRAFANSLLSSHPVSGLDPNTVLTGDVGKGMFKLVRAFHPDKNAYADDERKWICEEITKALCTMINAN